MLRNSLDGLLRGRCGQQLQLPVPVCSRDGVQCRDGNAAAGVASGDRRQSQLIITPVSRVSLLPARNNSPPHCQTYSWPRTNSLFPHLFVGKMASHTDGGKSNFSFRLRLARYKTKIHEPGGSRPPSTALWAEYHLASCSRHLMPTLMWRIVLFLPIALYSTLVCVHVSSLKCA